MIGCKVEAGSLSENLGEQLGEILAREYGSPASKLDEYTHDVANVIAGVLDGRIYREYPREPLFYIGDGDWVTTVPNRLPGDEIGLSVFVENIGDYTIDGRVELYIYDPDGIEVASDTQTVYQLAPGSWAGGFPIIVVTEKEGTYTGKAIFYGEAA